MNNGYPRSNAALRQVANVPGFDLPAPVVHNGRRFVAANRGTFLSMTLGHPRWRNSVIRQLGQITVRRVNPVPALIVAAQFGYEVAPLVTHYAQNPQAIEDDVTSWFWGADYWTGNVEHTPINYTMAHPGWELHKSVTPLALSGSGYNPQYEVWSDHMPSHNYTDANLHNHVADWVFAEPVVVFRTPYYEISRGIWNQNSTPYAIQWFSGDLMWRSLGETTAPDIGTDGGPVLPGIHFNPDFFGEPWVWSPSFEVYPNRGVGRLSISQMWTDYGLVIDINPNGKLVYASTVLRPRKRKPKGTETKNRVNKIVGEIASVAFWWTEAEDFLDVLVGSIDTGPGVIGVRPRPAAPHTAAEKIEYFISNIDHFSGSAFLTGFVENWLIDFFMGVFNAELDRQRIELDLQYGGEGNYRPLPQSEFL